MGVELFRLLLLIVGVLFLLGIYFWDRHKRINEEIILTRRTVIEKAGGALAKPRDQAQPPLPEIIPDQQGLEEEDLEAEDEDEEEVEDETPPPDLRGRSRWNDRIESFKSLLRGKGKEEETVEEEEPEDDGEEVPPPEPRGHSAWDTGIGAIKSLLGGGQRGGGPVARERTDPVISLDLPSKPEPAPLAVPPIVLEPREVPKPVPAAKMPAPASHRPVIEPRFEPRPELKQEPSSSWAETEEEGEDDWLPSELSSGERHEPWLASGPEDESDLASDLESDSEPEYELDDERELEFDDEPFTQREPEPARPVRAVPAASVRRPTPLSADEPILAPLPKDLPAKLLQISIVARGAFLEGEDILDAAEELGLRASRLRILHRVDPATNEVVYSVASMIEPGTFPLHDMGDFATPGVTLFLQLPCSIDGSAAFEDMLSTAERLAERLHAELQDQHHNLMTRQTIEHSRGEVQEHGRQVQLALRRRQR